MKLHLVMLLAMVAVPALRATAILDVTGQTNAQMQTGDILAFEIFGGSFVRTAANFGFSRYPTEISFVFLTATAPVAGSFSGALESADGAASVALGVPLTFGAGAFSGAGYAGAVSTLHGYLHLSALLSQELFSGGSAVLTLRNDGPEITVGLDPYTLRQSLYISLYGGPLTVGGIVSSVSLESAPTLLGLDAVDGQVSLESVSAAPEPDSSALFLAGGALLCSVSLGLNRIARRHK
jgi:hypothetical protein